MPASRLSAAPRKPLLMLWGLLTAVVVVCAYVIALAIAVGCGFLGVAVLGTFSFTSLIIGVGSLTCAAAILWSLVPRRDRFVPPGPELEAASQPRLFTEIASIAAEFREPMPVSVYLMFDANAWVAQRGGILGFGSRRVMALGLPLLSVLTVSEFRAVLAHEFGHYYGGDTGMGPWIQKAREALARSLQSLASDSGFLHLMSRWAYVAILRLIVIFIFSVYWKLFLRLTLLVSRQWEYRADELACAVGGAAPLVSGLEKVATCSLAWPSYWPSEAAPSLDAGFRPPLAEGFTRFLAAPEISRQIGPQMEKQLAEEKPHFLATHPTFKQRKARALSHRFAEPPADNASALSLLTDAGAVERAALAACFPDLHPEQLPEVAWESVGPVVYIPNWTQFTDTYREVLAGYRVADIPVALGRLAEIGAQIRDPKGMLLTREQRADRAVALLWMSFALVLVRAGWQVRPQPGACCLTNGDRQVDPAQTVRRLRRGEISESTFGDIVRDLGVAVAALTPAATAATSSGAA
jgi:heat shock protein HtpX